MRFIINLFMSGSLFGYKVKHQAVKVSCGIQRDSENLAEHLAVS